MYEFIYYVNSLIFVLIPELTSLLNSSIVRLHLFNSLTAMVADMRPLFFELRASLITFLIFVR